MVDSKDIAYIVSSIGKELLKNRLKSTSEIVEAFGNDEVLLNLKYLVKDELHQCYENISTKASVLAEDIDKYHKFLEIYEQANKKRY